jgi:hypothetical protein
MPRTRTWAQWAQSRSTHIWVGEGVIAFSLACFAVSAYFNARYASSLGQDESMQLAMKIAGLSIASLLALLAIGKHLIDTDRFRGVKGKALILVSLLAIAEVWSAMGSIVTGRSDMVGSRKIEATAVANATTDRARLQSELDTLSKRKVQPAGTLRAQLTGMQAQPFYAATKACTQNTGPYRNSCARYASVASQLGLAERKESLEAQLASATSTIAHAKGAAQSGADPQSMAMAATLGFAGIVASPDTIGLLAPLGIALVLMLAGWWGIEIGFAIRGIELVASAARPTGAQVLDFAPPAPASSTQTRLQFNGVTGQARVA